MEGEREKWGNSPLEGSDSCVLIPERSISYNNPWSIASLLLGCIGLCFVVATAIIFGVCRKTAIVKSSGRELMIILLVGVAVSFILPFFYVAPPSTPVCVINRFGVWFCYSLMFGALFIKVQRVARIFFTLKHNLTSTLHFITPVYQVLFTLGIVAIQVVFILFSLIFAPPEVQRILQHSRDDKNLVRPEIFVTCSKEETVVIALSLLYEGVIIIAATIIGVFTFKFPENFNEAKYISFCTFSLLVAWIGLIPAYFTTESRLDIQNAAVSIFIVLSAFGVLCFIFGPKMYIMLFKPQKNTHTNSTTRNMATGETDVGTEKLKKNENNKE